MKLPNVEAAVVEEQKIVAYLLNPNHPDGASKARFFSDFGFHIDQWQEMSDALRQLAQASPVVKMVATPHGEKYIVDGILNTPSGVSRSVRTVWIVDSGSRAPRLVTAFPQGRKT